MNDGWQNYGERRESGFKEMQHTDLGQQGERLTSRSSLQEHRSLFYLVRLCGCIGLLIFFFFLQPLPYAYPLATSVFACLTFKFVIRYVTNYIRSQSLLTLDTFLCTRHLSRHHSLFPSQQLALSTHRHPSREGGKESRGKSVYFSCSLFSQENRLSHTFLPILFVHKHHLLHLP